MKDRELWEAMDEAAEDVSEIFGGTTREILSNVRDGVGSTHHESGTLWMGDDACKSVTNCDGRFHYVNNAYVLGPSLFPTIGSPNPVLTGMALAMRTADKIIQSLNRIEFRKPEDGFYALFDGTDDTFKLWQEVGPGSFSLIGGKIIAYPRGESILFYSKETFKNFILSLEFCLDTVNDNSGVFLRFRYPLKKWEEEDLKHKKPVEIVSYTGFEVQIDEQAPEDKHRTGAIYDIEIGKEKGSQDYTPPHPLKSKTWYEFRISVEGQDYEVRLNGEKVATFTNTQTGRGKPAQENALHGYIGLQAHTGKVAFRNIRIKKT
jgi:hypothetical protein